MRKHSICTLSCSGQAISSFGPCLCLTNGHDARHRRGTAGLFYSRPGPQGQSEQRQRQGEQVGASSSLFPLCNQLAVPNCLSILRRRQGSRSAVFNQAGDAGPGKPENLQQISIAAEAGLGTLAAIRLHASPGCTGEAVDAGSPASTCSTSLPEPPRVARAWEGGSSLATESAELAGWLNLDSGNDVGSRMPDSAAAPGPPLREATMPGAVQQAVASQDLLHPMIENTQILAAQCEPAAAAKPNSQQAAVPEAVAGAAEESMTSLLAYLDSVQAQVFPELESAYV